MKLKKERFGRSDYRVSELCLSTSNFSRYASQEESFAILDAFREAGGNFIQTSGICPGVNLGDGFLGMPEELLGRWLKLRRINRSSLVIATRIALTRPVIGGLSTYTDLIRRCAQDSIRRIDGTYLGFLVVEWTDGIAPVAESVAALEAVIASREIRYIVPANFPTGRALEAFAATRRESGTIAGLQLDYSLAARSALESGMAKFAADHGLGVVARSPLAGGHLAGRSSNAALGALSARGSHNRHASHAAECVWPLLSSIARHHRHSPAQVALAWVLAHPQIASVLVSVSSVDQLRELLAATHLQLADTDIAQFGAAVTPTARAVGAC